MAKKVTKKAPKSKTMTNKKVKAETKPLAGKVKIKATSKAKHMIPNKEYVVGADVAKELINKGWAKKV